MALSPLMTRVGTAVVLIPVALGLIWVRPLRLGFVLFVVALAGVGLTEVWRMAKAKRIPIDPASLVIGGCAVVASAMLADLMIVNLVFAAAALTIFAGHLGRVDSALARLSVIAFGLVYLGWFPAHLVLLHGAFEAGPALVTALIVAVGFTDAGAYFVGKNLGRHKLAPVVSPHKTWEGAAGGTVCAVAALFIFVEIMNDRGILAWPLWFTLTTGVVLSVASQLGDLVESVLKRDAGIKDSGSIFPGHGGVLDRFDGFLFAIPVLYYMLML